MRDVGLRRSRRGVSPTRRARHHGGSHRRSRCPSVATSRAGETSGLDLVGPIRRCARERTRVALVRSPSAGDPVPARRRPRHRRPTTRTIPSIAEAGQVGGLLRRPAPCSSALVVLASVRRPVRGRVLRRLHHRVQPVGRQPLRLRDHHGQRSRCRAIYQQTVLLVGILIALVLRGIFIAAGRRGDRAFAWVFYLFGAFLVYTASGWRYRRRERRGGVPGERGAAAGPRGSCRSPTIPRRGGVHPDRAASGSSRRCSS